MVKIRKKIKADFLAHYDVKIIIKKGKPETESSQHYIALSYQLFENIYLLKVNSQNF